MPVPPKSGPSFRGKGPSSGLGLGRPGGPVAKPVAGPWPWSADGVCVGTPGGQSACCAQVTCCVPPSRCKAQPPISPCSGELAVRCSRQSGGAAATNSVACLASADSVGARTPSNTRCFPCGAKPGTGRCLGEKGKEQAIEKRCRKRLSFESSNTFAGTPTSPSPNDSPSLRRFAIILLSGRGDSPPAESPGLVPAKVSSSPPSRSLTQGSEGPSKISKGGWRDERRWIVVVFERAGRNLRRVRKKEIFESRHPLEGQV